MGPSDLKPTSTQIVLSLSLLSLLVGVSAWVFSALWPLMIFALGAGGHLLGRAFGRGDSFDGRARLLSAIPVPILLAVVTRALIFASEPIQYWVLLILVVEAILLWLPFSRRVLSLLGIVLAVHVLSLSLDGLFPYYPLLAPVAASILIAFWLNIFSSGYGRVMSRGEGGRSGRASDVEPYPTPNLRSAPPLRMVSLLIAISLGAGLVVFFLFPRIRIQLKVGDEETENAGAAFQRIVPDAGTAEGKSSKRRKQSEVGYTDTVSLRQRGPGFQDATRLMSVTCRDETGSPFSSLRSLTLRGSTLDTYDKGTWLRSPKRVELTDQGTGPQGWIAIPRRRVPPGRVIHQEVRMRPVISNVVFALPVITQVKASAIAVEIEDGCARFKEAAHGSREYEVISRWRSREDVRGVPIEDVDPPSRYVQLSDLDPRVERLAKSLIAGERTLIGKCEAIERYIRQNLTYSLDVDYTDSSDPVADILFDRKAGYCVHFASAMILMLRSVGIPSRMACGFVSSEFSADEAATFVIRRRNAHSWVEVRFGETGWIGFDPSPVQAPGYFEANATAMDRVRSWLRYMTSFDEVRRARLLDDLAALIPKWVWGAIVLLVVLGIAYRRVRRLDRERPGYARNRKQRSAVGFFDAYLELLSTEGIRRRTSSTPRELGESAKGIFPRGPVDLITHLFCETQYGDRELSPDEVHRAQQALQELRATRSEEA